MKEAEAIKEIYKGYWQCMIDKDDKGLRELMSEDYYLTHMTGVRQSADTFICGLLNGTFNYYSAEHDEIQVILNEVIDAGVLKSDGIKHT